MHRDFIKELGYKALDNRLKRISDRMAHDTRKFYKQIDVDIEPSWHLVFKLLQENDKITMAELAEQLGYTHPSMVVLLKKMKAKGYVLSEKDADDGRKQNIKLTRKSYDILPELEQIWQSCEKAIYEMLQKDLSIIKHLDEIEKALKITPINERFYREYHKSKTPDYA